VQGSDINLQEPAEVCQSGSLIMGDTVNMCLKINKGKPDLTAGLSLNIRFSFLILVECSTTPLYFQQVPLEVFEIKHF